MRRYLSKAAFASFTILTGCNGSGFGGGSTTVTGSRQTNPPGKGDVSRIDIGRLQDVLNSDNAIFEIKKPFEVQNGSVSLSFEPGFKAKTRDQKNFRPLSVLFVLDETGSMRPAFESIKSGIKQFAANLATKSFSVQLGLVTFNDSVHPPEGPLGIDAFVNAIAAKTPSGGDDANEGSLIAFKSGLSHALSQMSPESVKALLVITDEPGHDGQPIPRNCNISSVVNALDDLTQEQKKLVKLYHSVSGDNGASCDRYNTARAQWDDILNASLTDIPKNRRGGSLPYPFDGKVLVNDFVNLLETTIPGEELVCIVNRGDVLVDGKVVGNFSERDLEKMYQSYLAQKPFIWAAALNPEQLEKVIRAGSATAKLSACCMRQASLEAGDLSQCVESQDLSVRFSVVKK